MTVVAPSTVDHLVGVEVEHHEVPTRWGRQHVVTAGPVDAPAVLLVHGWPQHWLAWRHVIAALAPTRRVIAVDLRGFGWSTVTERWRVRVDDVAADLVHVLDHLGVTTATLVSHDWGGWIGFRATLDAPQRLAHHVAVGIVPPWLDPGAMARHALDWAYVVPMAVAGDRIARERRAVRWLLDHSTHVPVWDGDDGRAALESYLERIAQPDAAAMTRRLYAALVTHELPTSWGPRAGRLAVPTTVLVGEHETIARPRLYWGRTHPGELRVVTLPGARHWLAEERPEAVVSAVDAVMP